jgi:hypothetical protein
MTAEANAFQLQRTLLSSSEVSPGSKRGISADLASRRGLHHRCPAPVAGLESRRNTECGEKVRRNNRRRERLRRQSWLREGIEISSCVPGQ